MFMGDAERISEEEILDHKDVELHRMFWLVIMAAAARHQKNS